MRLSNKINRVRLRPTYEIAEHLAVGKSPCGDMVFKVPTVWRKICLGNSQDVVVVAYVKQRVTEQHDRRHQWPGIPGLFPWSGHKGHSQEQQAPHSHRDLPNHQLSCLEMDFMKSTAMPTLGKPAFVSPIVTPLSSSPGHYHKQE